MAKGDSGAAEAAENVADSPMLRELEKRIHELEGLLGKKTLEAEILKEAMELAPPKKPRSPSVS
ncbi:hypothetical protein [Rhodoblastus sp.]|uniref:hypothetical protein n=1 Tax=Rhodoblastus sp. TaxID=1962975 RepID=UPI003F972222